MDLMMELGAKSACFQYPGSIRPYPACSYISINHEVVHGTPSKNVILGDGYVGDNTKTIRIGNISKEVNEFVKVAENALSLGIAQAILEIGSGIFQCH
jgi:methionine aminopeptidase